MTDTFLQELIERLDNAVPEAIGGVIDDQFGRAFEADHAEAWLVDIGETRLTSVLRPDRSVPLDGSSLGPVYERGEPAAVDGTMMAPITVRGRPLGVLAVSGAEVPERVLTAAGTVIASALRATERLSDFVGILQGGEDVGLPATIQRSVLPDRDLADETVELSARIEPAYEAAGDAFDYASLDGRLDLALFDAVGHGTHSALLSSAAVGGYRYARRRLEAPSEMHGLIDGVIAEHGRRADFVTGVVCRIGLETGDVEGFNAGHPSPIVVGTDGLIRELGVERPGLPLGLSGNPATFSGRIDPGEILVLHSDGVSEAGRAFAGTAWGRENLFASLTSVVAKFQTLREVCRTVFDQMMSYAGPRLRDDATVVMARRR